MDQDLSLMSQLLKLNDKIEEVKTHVLYRKNNEAFSQSSCYLSNSEISDSEFEDNDDSRMDISHSMNSFANHFAKSPNPEPEEKEVVLRRITPAESDIIIYRKKARKGKRRRLTNQSRSGTDTDDDSAAESDSDSGSHSDTESTLSCNSCTQNSEHNSDNPDNSEDTFEADKKTDNKTVETKDEPPKKVKGGVSQNRRFLSFLKKNGNTLPGKSPLLTLQGHNVPLDKYFVPQGLVYLKHSNSDNVFCQFSN